MMIQTTVGEFCPFKYGKGLSANKRLSGVISVYGSNGVVGFHNEPLVKTHGVVIGRKGSVGALHISDGPFWPIDTSFYVVKGDYFETVYTYYLLKSLGLDGMNSDSAVPGLNRDNAHALKIVVLEQAKDRSEVGRLISIFDKKIENNRQMNETLEEMARAIFKSWFVDFDPVHAKAAGNPPAHMNADTAALFPSSFGDDGLPVGWSKIDVGSIVEVRKGLSYKGKFLCDDGVGMINLGCFGFKGTFKPQKIKSYTGDFKDRHKISAGDLIFANTDMTQDRAILCSPIIVPSYINEGEAIFSHHVSYVHLLVPQHPAFTELLRHFMMTPNFRMRAEGYATGTTVLAVPKNIFDGYHVPIPTTEILDTFFKYISSIAKKLEANYAENQTLADLRDTLLPKLMSGEIRVADAKRQVEAAA